MLEEGSYALGLLQPRWPGFSGAKGFSLGLFLVKLVPNQPCTMAGPGEWEVGRDRMGAGVSEVLLRF